MKNGSKRASDTTSPFEFPIFTAVWITSLVSSLGSLIQSVGASWYLTAHAATPTTVTLVQAAAAAPIVLLSLFAGALADNYDRRRIMIAAQAFMLAIAAGLAVIDWYNLLTPAVLLAATFALGCGNAISSPSWQASVGDMVSPKALPGAIAWNSMGFNAARSLGPAVGGAIVAAMGVTAAFICNALSYVGFIAVLFRWKPTPRDGQLPTEPVISAMASGLRFAALSAPLRSILAVSAASGLASSAIPALLPIIARDRFGDSALDLGILLGAFGVGAVAGGLLSARSKERWPLPGVVSCAALASAIGALMIASSHSFAVTIAALLMAGAGWVFILALLNILVQSLTPRWITGRALALLQMAAFGGSAIGSWLSGVAATALGVSMALTLFGLLQVLPILTTRLLRHLDLAPTTGDTSATLSPLKSTLAVEDRDGPIEIFRRYSVAESRVAAFQQAMASVRLTMLRNGAKSWKLVQDVNDPESWTEMMSTSTWLEFRRMRTHFTLADQELFGSLQQFAPSDPHSALMSAVTVNPSRPASVSGQAITDAFTCR